MAALVAACTPPARVDPGPGAAPLPVEMRQAIAARARDAPPGGPPRTRHLDEAGRPRFTNRLAAEPSPYLQQHAHNPVSWFPWGEEALARARALGRPIFLSIGYSTCHWCHVMEEESFEDLEIARLLNEEYIPIKVDREERPDLDNAYMTAVRQLTGRGGWPLSVWLTAEGQPFFGGTYFPARDGDRGTPTGLLTLLQRLAAEHRTQGPTVAARAAELTAQVRAELTEAPRSEGVPGPDVLERAVSSYRASFDEAWGGLRHERKFPSEVPVRLLLRQAQRARDGRARAMAELTLEKMAAGGLRDHLGGGFHRYSTDARWLVPHFEKMLYDNALLALAYLEAWQATGRGDFRAVAEETLRWIDEEMSAPEGGLYAAIDADSLDPTGRLREGAYYTWTPDELKRATDPATARVLITYFAVEKGGNLEGRSVLWRPFPPDLVSTQVQLSPPEVLEVVNGARPRLLEARGLRSAPLRDEKVLTAWNGLALAAFARAAFALGSSSHLERARRLGAFLLERAFVEPGVRGGRVWRSLVEGQGRTPGVLDDHAFLAWGLLELYQATGEVRWLRGALALDRHIARHFEDPEGGFFLVSDEENGPLARERPAADGALPSGTSVHTLTLLRLAELTLDDSYRTRAVAALRSLGGRLAAQPTRLAELLLAVDWQSGRPREVVVVTPGAREDAATLLDPVRAAFLPRVVWTVVRAADVDELGTELPIVVGKLPRDGKPTAYVCERGTCLEPTTDPAVLLLQLEDAPAAALPPRGP